MKTNEGLANCDGKIRIVEHTNFTVPSQEADANVALLIFDQSTENTSLVCSCHTRIGRSYGI